MREPTLSRRSYLKATATGLASLLASSAQAAPKPRLRPNVRYALSTGSWNVVIPPGSPLPLLRILDETAAAGFNGVRLTGFPRILEQNGIREEALGDELARRGLLFSTISFGGTYYDKPRQEEILTRARRALALHRRLGATAAVFFPPPPVPAAEEAGALAETCRFCNEMGKMAQNEFGIRMGLHNHTDSLVENQAQVDYYLEHTDPASVFCAWDTAHLLLGGCDVIATFQKSLDRIVYTDFKDATRKPASQDYVAPNGTRHPASSKSGRFYNSIFELGRGEIDFPPLMQMLKQKHYQGWINHDLDTIRVSCPESWRVAREYIETNLDPIYQ